jgi:peptidoglycan/xylan/chitin deacetylase (PgdA/CDA1 family)
VTARAGVSSAARLVARLGGGALARGWRALRGAPGRGIVLMYHRVAEEPDYLGLSVTPQCFARQLDVLARSLRLVPLGELVARLADPAPLAHDLGAITFDDGYRDNLDTALPLLAAQGVPATVFVSTDFIDGACQPAGVRLREACAALWERSPEAVWPGDGAIDASLRRLLASPGSLQGLARFRRALKALPVEEGERVMTRLEDLAGSARARRGMMLDWEGVRRLVRGGVEIGAHAVSHGILSRMSRQRADEEIRESKRRIEAETGIPVPGFAFPNGGEGDFCSDDLATLRLAGYAYACTAVTGTNAPGCDPFQLRRIGVGNDSAELLALKLAMGRAG